MRASSDCMMISGSDITMSSGWDKHIEEVAGTSVVWMAAEAEITWSMSEDKGIARRLGYWRGQKEKYPNYFMDSGLDGAEGSKRRRDHLMLMVHRDAIYAKFIPNAGLCQQRSCSVHTIRIPIFVLFVLPLIRIGRVLFYFVLSLFGFCDRSIHTSTCFPVRIE